MKTSRDIPRNHPATLFHPTFPIHHQSKEKNEVFYKTRFKISLQENHNKIHTICREAMAAAAKVCPENAFRYNGSLCACNPGMFFSNGSCSLFATSEKDWSIGSGVTSTPTFLTTVLPLESIRRITQSQAVLLEATLVALVIWLLFCVGVRFGRVDGGRSVWFRIRWWISRLDVSFATNHWLVWLLSLGLLDMIT